MKKITVLLAAFVLLLGSCSQNQPILKIGLVADPQYEDKNTAARKNFQTSYDRPKEWLNLNEKLPIDAEHMKAYAIMDEP